MTGQPDHWLAMRRASAATGLEVAGARLIHHYSNAIYVLPAENAVARVTYGRAAAERVTRSQAITRWLAQDYQFPATRPLDNTSPVTVNSAVVSFWAYYPQPEDASPLTSGQLAVLLRLLHRAGTPGRVIVSWMPCQCEPARAAQLGAAGTGRSHAEARVPVGALFSRATTELPH